MTGDEFRELALSLPEAAEGSHMDHPDFRVGGRIFATLGPGEDWGMVKLKPDQQALLMREADGAFDPAPGAWGLKGATIVMLEGADWDVVRSALRAAWRNTAPKKLVRQFADLE